MHDRKWASKDVMSPQASVHDRKWASKDVMSLERIKDLETTIATRESQIASAESNAKKSDEQIAKLQADLEEKDREGETILHQYETRIAELDKDIREKLETIEQLGGRVDALSREKEEVNELNTDLMQQLSMERALEGEDSPQGFVGGKKSTSTKRSGVKDALRKVRGSSSAKETIENAENSAHKTFLHTVTSLFGRSPSKKQSKASDENVKSSSGHSDEASSSTSSAGEGDSKKSKQYAFQPTNRINGGGQHQEDTPVKEEEKTPARRKNRETVQTIALSPDMSSGSGSASWLVERGAPMSPEVATRLASLEAEKEELAKILSQEKRKVNRLTIEIDQYQVGRGGV